MTSANELAALADEAGRWAKSEFKNPHDARDFATRVEAALRATSTAGVREALRIAVGHIDHMAAWITETNKKAKWSNEIYSFEGIGEDMPGIKAALSSPTNSEWNAAVEACAKVVKTQIPDPDNMIGNPLWSIADSLEKAIRSLHRGEAQRSDDGVESRRHAATGNMPGAAPGEDQSSSASSFVRVNGPEDKALKPRAGVASGPSDTAPKRLPYSTPFELFKAFKAGEKFVLHYHGRIYEVERMSARKTVVYVQPPGLPVKINPDGSSAEGPGKGIWLAKADRTAQQTDGIDHEAINVLRIKAFELHPASQYRLAFFIAENVGYILEREPDHPDSPHAPQTDGAGGSVMRYALIPPFIVALTLGYFAFNDYQKKQIAVAAFNYAERTRPSFNALCTSYFQWSEAMKDRVPSMEEQCGAKP